MIAGIVGIIAAIVMSWIVEKYRNSGITIHFALDAIIQFLHIFTFAFLSCVLLINELFLFRLLSFYCFHKTCKCFSELVDDFLYFFGFYNGEDDDDEIQEQEDDNNPNDENESKKLKK